MGTEEPSDEHITMLLGMGFTDLDYVRKALQLAKNDLNEAVAILTGEVNKSGFDTHPDVEMKEASQNGDSSNNNIISSQQFGPHLDDSKVEIVDSAEDVPENIDMPIEEMPEEFPVTNLYELEDRIFIENWSIPYKKNESLAKCLYAATKLSFLQKAEQDEHCKKFMDRIVPECYNKLLCSPAVKKWTPDVLEGVFNMILLFVDLAAVRLKYKPVPVKILESLAQCFDSDSAFHFKNRSHKWDRSHYEDLFGYGKCPAMCPAYNAYKDPFGWLVDLVNRFCHKGGLDAIIEQIDSVEKVTPSIFASLLKPLGLCAKYLNRDVVGYQLGGPADKIVHYINDLQADDMKEKEVDKVYDLLRTLHYICDALWPEKTSAIDELHLNTILKMLNLPHFNARMNALKELSKLIKEAEKERWSNIAHRDVILKWLLEHKVISIAFSSSLHHAQYCEKLKNIVEFASTKLSTEELTTIWRMQNGKHVTVIDNIHSIILSASQNFSTEQLEHLLSLLEVSWKEEDEKSKERLLLLIGKIGREIRDNKIVLKMLSMLWALWHVETLPLYLVNQAVQSHLDILTESSAVKTSVKTEYVSRCVSDIKQGSWVVPAVRHMLHNLQSTAKTPFAKNAKAAIQELENQHDLFKLLCNSLSQCHKSIASTIPCGTLSGDTIINNMYTYAETVITHLKLIEFLLQEGGYYLRWHRCKDIWDCLMLDTQNCEGDYQTCFEWFVNCIADLSAESQKELFVTKILKTDVSKMKEIGFKCFKSYFESVNISEHKMKRTGPAIVVEKQELTGISFLWQLILHSPYPNIAEDATQYLINVTYNFLSAKLKKTENASTHNKFMSECCKKLDGLIAQLQDEDDTGPKEQKITKTFKKPLPVKGANRSELLSSVERLLNLVCYYIISVEENYMLMRSYPPHGTCFHGFLINIHVNYESNKTEFDLSSHTNEKLSSLRQKIASKLSSQPDQVQIYKNEKLLPPSKDHKLLSQLEFDEKQVLNVKTVAVGASVNFVEYTNTEADLSSLVNKPSSLLEKERALPSFIVAVDLKIFDKLYKLGELEEQRTTAALQNLILHLPTDTNVLEAIDIFSFQNPLSCSPGTRAGYDSSSSSVLENYFKCSAPNMSTFRVLYNLQVLSSKLMPVLSQDLAAITHSFRENWLNAGGLSLIMNILLPDTLPSNADYELCQSCYYIILQLARFLLCGEDYELALVSDMSVVRTYGQATAEELTTQVNTSSCSQMDCTLDVSMESSTPVKLPNSPKRPQQQQSTTVASSWPGAKPGNNGSPVSVNQLSSSPGSAASFTPDNGSLRKRMRSASVLDSVSPTVKMVIESLNEEEFSETIASLLQVAWSAAAGQLQLNVSHRPKESGADTNTVSSPTDELKAGLCLRQEQVSSMDSTLSNSSLELLIMCLQLRPKLLDVFYNFPNVQEFIIDILCGSPSYQVRTSAALHFAMLANSPIMETSKQHPKSFLFHVLMKAHLPYWTVSSAMRGVTFKLLLQCQQFFELLSNIVFLLPHTHQSQYGIDVKKLLEDELIFLTNSDNVNVELLRGHLKLINALFTCEKVDKQSDGSSYIKFLMDSFLFSAYKLVNNGTSLSSISLMEMSMNSYDVTCRKEAFNLLLTLADRCPANLHQIARQLTSQNHSHLSTKEWDYHPPVSARPIDGFVGLKNACATCYMNSILQQLYMQPGIREAVLKVDDVTMQNPDNIFFQLQIIFGHLLESQTQYYVPESFWKSFKLWGEPVNVREQQDAFEFFINITDQLDENLKLLKKEEIFKKTFSGMFVDQKICKDCSHTFERDEAFFSLPVTVKCGNLEASLEQFVHNEMMEGENAYYCEKCCERRTTVKRTCIKTLPPVLVIQLKRFWYDWERSRAIKFDDYFSFPWVLDVEPYTQEGIAKRENEAKSNASTPSESKPMQIITDTHRFYELVGVVVHSGQASAGHYYSFIKNRQNTTGEFNKWYKFNDISTENFEMTDEALEMECFGGEYRVPQSDANSQYPENRVRNWNGYMLFYETMDKNRLPRSSTMPLQDPRGQILGDVLRSYPASPASSTASSNPPSPGSKDTCVNQLSALIRKGERKGLFNDNMPASTKRLVNEQNVEFLGNRDVYNEDYFWFIQQLCSSNVTGGYASTEESDSKQANDAFLCSMELAIHFLVNTYLRTAKSFRSDMDSWSATIENLMSSSAAACSCFIEFFASEEGKGYILPYLIECPDKIIREMFANLLFLACHYLFKLGGNTVTDALDEMISKIVLLEREISQYIKQSAQYFTFVYRYACICHAALVHVSEKHVFRIFHSFLLGPGQSNSERTVRRWTAIQTQELTSLHNVLCLIILNTDSSHMRTGSSTIEPPSSRHILQYSDQVSMTDGLKDCLYGREGDRYLQECLYAAIELPQLSETISDSIMYTCWCNMPYSIQFIRKIQNLLSIVQVNDIQHMFAILTDVWSLEDSHQEMRIEFCIDGSLDNNIVGLFSLIRSSHDEDARRAYQCIKFLIGTANKLLPVKQYLIGHSVKWQWAVDWLKNKMSEHSYWPAQTKVTNDKHTSFQRTYSAQNTLAEATKLLTEIETHDQKRGVVSESVRKPKIEPDRIDEEEM